MTSNRLAPVSAPEESSAEKLLHSAKQLFARKGYEGASVKEIADLAGVNISLVSYHFGGKEGLYRAIIEAIGRDILGRVQKILEPARDAADFRHKIEDIMASMVDHYLEEPDSVRVLHRECDMEHGQNTQDIFKETLLEVFACLQRFIEAAQVKGFLRQDLAPMAVATIITSAVGRMVHMDPLGQKYFNVSLRDEGHRKMMLRNLSEVFFHGMAPQPTQR